MKYLFSVPEIISAMAIYEETKTCESYFVILDKVEKMEKVINNFQENLKVKNFKTFLS